MKTAAITAKIIFFQPMLNLYKGECAASVGARWAHSDIVKVLWLCLIINIYAGQQS